jgi:hypothetical protein
MLDRYLPADAADRQQFVDEVMIVLEELTHDAAQLRGPVLV